MPQQAEMMNPLLSLGGGMVAALIAGSGLMHIGQKHLESLPTLRGTPSTFKDVKKEHKLNVGYMHSPVDAGENAFFVRKEDLIDLIEEYKDDPLFDPKPFSRMLRAAKKHGLVVTGKGFKKPGVIEHELGHAIATHKGTGWEQFTHGAWAPALSELGALGGLGAGLVVGTLSPGLKYRGLGALAGAGIAGLGNVPMVSRELTANRYGATLMDDETNERVKNWPFVGTYVNAGITMPAVTGALAQEIPESEELVHARDKSREQFLQAHRERMDSMKKRLEEGVTNASTEAKTLLERHKALSQKGVAGITFKDLQAQRSNTWGMQELKPHMEAMKRTSNLDELVKHMTDRLGSMDAQSLGKFMKGKTSFL